MTDTNQKKRPHFILPANGKAESFTPPPRRPETGDQTHSLNRERHGAKLLGKVRQLKETLSETAKKQREAENCKNPGLQIEFESFPDVELEFESLAREASGIELQNVRYDANERKTFATVFVPDGKLDILENQVLAYIDSNQDGAKVPRHNKLLSTVADMRTAALKALWTDSWDLFPTEDSEEIWWEVWLPAKHDKQETIDDFRSTATKLGFKLAAGELIFPERIVSLVYGSLDQMRSSLLTLNNLSELRRAKETAEFFDSIEPEEQHGWVDELNSRLTAPLEDMDVPYVCLLDTGVNNGHPLLQPLLANKDLHTVEPGWGVDDQEGHGTGLAGVALYGDLSEALEINDPIILTHRLESVKLLPKSGANSNDALHHGYLTLEAVSRPMIQAPARKRVFSMTATAEDNRDLGRPTAWSASIDQFVSDASEQGADPRLFITSAGNISDLNAWRRYPNSNSEYGIHDPAQAWNALTVGAMTNLVNISGPDTQNYQPIAPKGGLSPFSTTSHTWEPHWPLKPDVVFEGGNAAKDAISPATLPSLSLLTTNAKMHKRLFTLTNATSAASAVAARMAAQVMSQYPQLWPETVRGLIVHSAEWTPAMIEEFLPSRGQPSKAKVVELIRHCGFGVPSLERALWSMNNSLTLICEDSLYPFKRKGSDTPVYNEMNLHPLPWPLEELQSLGEVEVEMRVTLSYFIEPNPSARGVISRYRYESHGLRFDVKRPLENEMGFRTRINKKAREGESYTSSGTSDPAWFVGPSGRHRGSIHSDIWKGTAAELASRGVIAIYPSAGWWKSRQALKQYDRAVRYSLIVSIKAPEVEVDLYTPIENQISVPISVSG